MAAGPQGALTPSPCATGDVLPACRWVARGAVSYEEGLRLQAEARAAVMSGACRGVVITLQHNSVVTIGRSGGLDHLRFDPAGRPDLAVVTTDRGGDVTGHNPGQLVVYPVLDLSAWKKDVVWYVRTLEEVVIRTLADFGLRAGRKARYTGVWLGDEKITAIGVSVRRWITGHGLALNVCNDLSLFDMIVPCGIREFGVTNLARAGVSADIERVTAALMAQFVASFPCDLVKD